MITVGRMAKPFPQLVRRLKLIPKDADCQTFATFHRGLFAVN